MAKATVVAHRKLELVFVTSILCLQLCTSLQKGTSIYTVTVSRRITDIYFLSSNLNSHESCDATLKTYLVDERECVSDQELFSGCRSTIIPTTQSIIPVANISNQTSIVTDSVSNNFIINGTKELVNSSFCNISSLEVYRGREQAIEISHEGFYLSDSGSVEIHKDQLAYVATDFIGELYRMNLSCTGGGLPECGSLFFKVFGKTNVTNAKFNSTVPGTLTELQDTNATTERSDTSIFSTNVHVTTTTPVPTTEDSTTETFVGSVLFYVVVGAAGGIISFTFSFVIVCVLIGFSVRRKRKSHTLTITSTPQPHNGVQIQGPEPSPYENPQTGSIKRADESTLISDNDLSTRNANCDDNNCRVAQDRYQVQHFSQNHIEHPSAPLQKGARAESRVLDTWSNEGNKSLALCATVQCLDSKMPLNDSKEALELLQVYDTVNPMPSEERVAEGEVYSQLSHPVCQRKQSLPAYLGAPQYSALGGMKRSSPHKKIRAGHEVPDVKTKVQTSDIMKSSMHKVSSCSCPPLLPFIAESKDTDDEHTYALCAMVQCLDSKMSLNDSNKALELSQVYDTVSPKPSEGRVAAGEVYSQLSHPVRQRKQSLPAYLGAPQYSALGAMKSKRSSPHTKVRESMPVYEVPESDVKTELQTCSTMKSSTSKVSSCSCPPLPHFIEESKDTDEEHTYAILEQDQLQQSTSTQDDSDNILEQEAIFANAIITKSTDTDHTYAILEQDQLLSYNKQTESEHKILEEEKLTKNWTFDSLQSIPERKHSISREANFEPVQIYNTIDPKLAKTGVAEEQLSYQAGSKKQSLPSYLEVRPTVYSGSNIRSAPEVKKKQKKIKKNGSEDPSSSETAILVTGSHKISTSSCPPLSLISESVDSHDDDANTIDEQNSLVLALSRLRKESTAEHTQYHDQASLVDDVFVHDEPTSLSLAPKEVISEIKIAENEREKNKSSASPGT